MGCSKNDNTIIVSTQNGLSVEKVEIRNGSATINRKNDLELFSASLKTVFNGIDLGNLETEYGENDFVVIYDNSYYYSFRHFIFTDFESFAPDGHKYEYDLYARNDTLYLNVNITGEKPMNFIRSMIKKEEAEFHICNTPIDKAGGIYNMKEMELTN